MTILLFLEMVIYNTFIYFLHDDFLISRRMVQKLIYFNLVHQQTLIFIPMIFIGISQTQQIITYSQIVEKMHCHNRNKLDKYNPTDVLFISLVKIIIKKWKEKDCNKIWGLCELISRSSLGYFIIASEVNTINFAALSNS